MKSFYIRRPEMFDESAKGKSKGIVSSLLIFLLVYAIAMFAEMIIPLVIAAVDVIKMAGTMENVLDITLDMQLNSLPLKLSMLFSPALSLIVIILYCLCLENRKLTSMGIKKEHAARDYLVGGLTGSIIISAIVLVNILLGGMEFNGFNGDFSVGLLLVFLAGFIVQGMSEECIFRGYLMNTIGGKHSMAAAVIISSAVYTAISNTYKGMILLNAVNLILISIFFSLYMICFDNIWGVCAMHTAWSFVQSNIFGIKVSDMRLDAGSVINITLAEENSLINGGEAGVNGGLGTTIVLLVSLALLIAYMIKTGKAGFAEKTSAENT